MKPLIQHLCSTAPALMPVWVDAAVKSVAILGLTAIAAFCMRRASAAARHLVWLLGMASLLMLPILAALLPAWHVLPGWAMPVATVAVVADGRANVPAPPSLPPMSKESEIPARPGQALETPAVAGPEEIHSAPISVAPLPAAVGHAIQAISTKPAAPAIHIAWQVWILIGWLIVAAALLARIGLGMVSLWWLGRRSPQVTDQVWIDMLRALSAQLAARDKSRAGRTCGFRSRAASILLAVFSREYDSSSLLARDRNPRRAAARDFCHGLPGIRRRIELLSSPHRAMPMVWGIWRIRLLLPAESAGWSEEHRRAVLLHELAHARRHDCLTQLIAQFVRAWYWFNPLAWLACNHMAAEREMACDDLVIEGGSKPSAYAEQLLHIAAEMPMTRSATSAIAMARPSALEGRVRAILDARRNRKTITFAAAVVAAIAALVVTGCIAVLFGKNPKSNGATVATVANPDVMAHIKHLSGPELASLGDAAQATLEAAEKLPNWDQVAIPSSCWKPSIAALHPIRVEQAQDYWVRIILRSHDGVEEGLLAQSDSMAPCQPLSEEVDTPLYEWSDAAARTLPDRLVNLWTYRTLPSATAAGWGWSPAGLQYRIVPPAQSIPINHQATVDVEVKNISDHPLNIADIGQLAIRVAGVSSANTWSMGPMEFIGKENVTLKPGQSQVFTLPVDEQLTKPGRYQVEVEFSKLPTDNFMDTGPEGRQCPPMVLSVIAPGQTEPPLGDPTEWREGPWGPEISGMQIRLVAEKRSLEPGASRAFLSADARNFGRQRMQFTLAPPSIEFECDGVWYHRPADFHYEATASYPFAPGNRWENIFASLTDDLRNVDLCPQNGWESADGKKLFFGSGKHTVRLALTLLPAQGEPGKSLRLVSNAIELQQAPPGTESATRPAPAEAQPAPSTMPPPRITGFMFGQLERRDLADAVEKALLVGRIGNGSARVKSLPLPPELRETDDYLLIGFALGKAYFGNATKPFDQQVRTVDLATGEVAAFAGGFQGALENGIRPDPLARAGRRLVWDPHFATTSPDPQQTGKHNLFVFEGQSHQLLWRDAPGDAAPPLVWLDDNHILTASEAASDSNQTAITIINVTSGASQQLGVADTPWAQLFAPPGGGGDVLIIGKNSFAWVVNAEAAIAGTGKIEDRPAHWGQFTLEKPFVGYPDDIVSVGRLSRGEKELARAGPGQEIVVSISPDGADALWHCRKFQQLDVEPINFIQAGARDAQQIGQSAVLFQPAWLTAAQLPAPAVLPPRARATQPGTQPTSFEPRSAESPPLTTVETEGLYELVANAGSTPIYSAMLDKGDQYGFARGPGGKIFGYAKDQWIPLNAPATVFNWKHIAGPFEHLTTIPPAVPPTTTQPATNPAPAGPSASVRVLSTPAEIAGGKFHWLITPSAPLVICIRCDLLDEDGKTIDPGGEQTIRIIDPTEIVGGLTSDGCKAILHLRGFHPRPHDVPALFDVEDSEFFGGQSGNAFTRTAEDPSLTQFTADYAPFAWAERRKSGKATGTVFCIARTATPQSGMLFNVVAPLAAYHVPARRIPATQPTAGHYENMLYALGAFPVAKLTKPYWDNGDPGKVYSKGERIDVDGWLPPRDVDDGHYLTDAEKVRYGIPVKPLTYERYIGLLDVVEYKRSHDPLQLLVMRFTLQALRDHHIAVKKEDILRVYEAGIGLESEAVDLLKGQLTSADAMRLLGTYKDERLFQVTPAPTSGDAAYAAFLEDQGKNGKWSLIDRLVCFRLLWEMDPTAYQKPYRQFLLDYVATAKDSADRGNLYEGLISLKNDESFAAVRHGLTHDPSTECRNSILWELQNQGVIAPVMDAILIIANGKDEKHSYTELDGPGGMTAEANAPPDRLDEYLKWAKAQPTDAATAAKIAKAIELLGKGAKTMHVGR